MVFVGYSIKMINRSLSKDRYLKIVSTKNSVGDILGELDFWISRILSTSKNRNYCDYKYCKPTAWMELIVLSPSCFLKRLSSLSKNQKEIKWWRNQKSLYSQGPPSKVKWGHFEALRKVKVWLFDRTITNWYEMCDGNFKNFHLSWF